MAVWKRTLGLGDNCWITVSKVLGLQEHMQLYVKESALFGKSFGAYVRVRYDHLMLLWWLLVKQLDFYVLIEAYNNGESITRL